MAGQSVCPVRSRCANSFFESITPETREHPFRLTRLNFRPSAISHRLTVAGLAIKPRLIRRDQTPPSRRRPILPPGQTKAVDPLSTAPSLEPVLRKYNSLLSNLLAYPI